MQYKDLDKILPDSLVWVIKSFGWIILLLIYLCNLHTPVEKVLGANVVLVLSDVVKEAAIWHKLCDKLDGGSKADSQQAAYMRIVNASHYISFLTRKRENRMKHSLMDGRSIWMEEAVLKKKKSDI